MSPKRYKVTYFNYRGLAEPTRWLLCYMGEDFEDIRLTHEEWPSIKDTVPFGKLPILECDGKKICQSIATARYLGRKAGLAGKDAWEDLQIDIIIDTIQDIRREMFNYYTQPDEKVKEEMKEKFASETLPFYTEKLEAIAKENDGYLANGKLSWGDIYFVTFLDTIISIKGPDFLEQYPTLAALAEKVKSIPKIKAWIDKRPETEF